MTEVTVLYTPRSVADITVQDASLAALAMLNGGRNESSGCMLDLSQRDIQFSFKRPADAATFIVVARNLGFEAEAA